MGLSFAKAYQTKIDYANYAAGDADLPRETHPFLQTTDVLWRTP